MGEDLDVNDRGLREVAGRCDTAAMSTGGNLVARVTGAGRSIEV